MAIAGISVFVNLCNSLKEPSYDLPIMRVLGASRVKLLLIIISEGTILTFIDSILGIALGNAVVELIGHFQENEQAKFTGMVLISGEYNLLAIGLIIGIIADLIPSFQAYQSNISSILAKN